MKKTIKGVLIDAHNRKVRAVEVEQYHFKAMYDLIKCDCFCAYSEISDLPKGQTLWIDDEALLKSPIVAAFEIGMHFVCGNGLLLGTNEMGESTDAVSTVEEIEALVVWPPAGWSLPQDVQDRMTQWTITEL